MNEIILLLVPIVIIILNVCQKTQTYKKHNNSAFGLLRKCCYLPCYDRNSAMNFAIKSL